MEATETQRVATSQLVRWCPAGEFYSPYLDDELCPADNCGSTNLRHRLRKRRMLICSNPDCKQAYFTKEDFNDHDCGSAY